LLLAQGLLRGILSASPFLFARGGLYQTREPARWRRQSATSSTPAGLSKLINMTDDVEVRRRRAAYRAHHRGTKEMDWILGRFADARLGGFSTEELGMFERMLSLSDPDLQDMILHPELKPAGEFAELVGQVRFFHGLEP
jgi:antitoxin CptB